MKRNNFYRVALLTLAVSFYSCDDIVIKDISDEEVTLLAPQDSAVFETGMYDFWWSPVEGVDGYQLVVASPTLKEANVLALDTTVAKQTFKYALPAGQYQWCVRAVNSGYHTNYSCRTITIK